MKAGCNVWRALRDIKGSRAQHTTWMHLGGRPMRGEPLGESSEAAQRGKTAECWAVDFIMLNLR